MSRFNKGDDVLAIFDDGSKQHGFYSHEYEGKIVVKIYDSLKSFDHTQVSKYDPIDEEVVNQWCQKEASKVVAIIQKAMKSNFPDLKYILEIQHGNTVILDGISLLPKIIQVATIGYVMEFPGWQLTDWKFYQATRWEPEDMVDLPISEHRSSFDAAKSLINYALNMRINRWFETEGLIIDYNNEVKNSSPFTD